MGKNLFPTWKGFCIHTSALVILSLLMIILPTIVESAVITVGPMGDFKTIQAAIDASAPGDVVFVTPGTYKENINFRGKNIVVRSFNPANPAVISSTIIDADQKGSAVTFAGSETSACILMGFTIMNGNATYGGGICGNAASVSIYQNIITDNKAYLGGGIYSCNGTIKNNIIRNNIAESEFVTDSKGAGIYHCNGIIQNNFIYNNRAEYIGGGLYQCGGRIENNTIYKNSAGSFGGGLGDCNSTLKNCIVWGNTAPFNPQMHPRQSSTFSCFENGNTSLGNINVNPEFVDANNFNLHLKAISPCIDAGTVALDLNNDIDNDPRPVDGTDIPRGDGSQFDIGADEYVAPCIGLLKPDDRNLTPPFNTFYLPIMITYEGNNPIETFGFDVTFDPARLAYNTVNKAGSLTANWNTVQGNLHSAGRARIGAYKGEGTPVSSNGNLVFVGFDVLTNTGGEFNLKIENLVDDLQGFCTGKGKIVIGVKGDVNEDGKITPADAQIVFEDYLQGKTVNEHHEADVNCDLEITPADANEILKHYLNPGAEWPC